MNDQQHNNDKGEAAPENGAKKEKQIKKSRGKTSFVKLTLPNRFKQQQRNQGTVSWRR